jgi:hypothetical protein
MTERKGAEGTKTRQKDPPRIVQGTEPVIPLPEYYDTLSTPGKRRARKLRQKQIAIAKEEMHRLERPVQSKQESEWGSLHHLHGHRLFLGCGHVYYGYFPSCTCIRYYPRSRGLPETNNRDNDCRPEVLLSFASYPCGDHSCMTRYSQVGESSGEQYQRTYLVSVKAWIEFVKNEISSEIDDFSDLWDLEREYQNGLRDQILEGNKTSRRYTNLMDALQELVGSYRYAYEGDSCSGERS